LICCWSCANTQGAITARRRAGLIRRGIALLPDNPCSKFEYRRRMAHTRSNCMCEIRSVVLQLSGQRGEIRARIKCCNVETRVSEKRKIGKHTRNECDYLDSETVKVPRRRCPRNSSKGKGDGRRVGETFLLWARGGANGAWNAPRAPHNHPRQKYEYLGQQQLDAGDHCHPAWKAVWKGEGSRVSCSSLQPFSLFRCRAQLLDAQVAVANCILG
jgi:hypothetical protein